jgi:hypothetical protein
MTDCPISFPALAFGEEAEWCAVPGVEGLQYLRGAEELFAGTSAENLRRLTWEIIDSANACWRIAESPVVGRPSWFSRAIDLLTGQRPAFVFEPRIERLPAPTLDEAKARIVAAMRGNPDIYLDDEVVAGEANEPFEDPAILLEAVCAHVEAASTFEAVIAAVEVDQFTLDVVKKKPGRDDDGPRSYRGCYLTPVAIVAVAIGIYELLPSTAQAVVRHFLGQAAIFVLGTIAIIFVLGLGTAAVDRLKK